MCPDAFGQGTSNAAIVVIWAGNGGSSQQSNVNGNGTITAVQSGLCLDTSGAGTADGTKIIVWSCNVRRKPAMEAGKRPHSLRN
jgi:hypothetical protein